MVCVNQGADLRFLLTTVGGESKNLHPDQRKPRVTHPMSDDGFKFIQLQIRCGVSTRHFDFWLRVEDVMIAQGSLGGGGRWTV